MTPASAPLAAPAQRAPAPHQRTRGAAEVRFAGGRLARLYTAGSAKAITLPGPAPEVVFLNTSGGLTGGDRLRYALDSDGPVTATTQTAERAYRTLEGVAEVAVDLAITRGRLDWLPQETILFDRSALRRRTRIALGPQASCLMLEAVVLGRAAMGETVRAVFLDDRREITRAGRPVLVEPLRLGTEALGQPATLGEARAFASLALVAPGAEDALGPVRAALGEPGVRGAASAFDGKLTLRLMAADGWPLRRQILRLLEVLRGTDPAPHSCADRPAPPAGHAPALPRVWQS